MANRRFEQFQGSLEHCVVTLYGSATIGASGAVSAYKGGGITSIVKEATAGQYTVTLQDKYSRLLNWSVDVVSATISTVQGAQLLATPATYQATFASSGALTFQCVAPTSSSDTTLVATNPASGTQLVFTLVVRNSSVGRFD